TSPAREASGQSRTAMRCPRRRPWPPAASGGPSTPCAMFKFGRRPPLPTSPGYARSRPAPPLERPSRDGFHCIPLPRRRRQHRPATPPWPAASLRAKAGGRVPAVPGGGPGGAHPLGAGWGGRGADRLCAAGPVRGTEPIMAEVVTLRLVMMVLPLVVLLAASYRERWRASLDTMTGLACLCVAMGAVTLI